MWTLIHPGSDPFLNTTPSDIPTHRSEHSAVSRGVFGDINNPPKIWIFGGTVGKIQRQKVVNDVWEFDLSMK
jgi:hypothetical protein